MKRTIYFWTWWLKIGSFSIKQRIQTTSEKCLPTISVCLSLFLSPNETVSASSECCNWSQVGKKKVQDFRRTHAQVVSQNEHAAAAAIDNSVVVAFCAITTIEISSLPSRLQF